MREGVVVVDGSRGEGGGQILRTSLALSMITGRPLRMEHIRAGRPKPGLRPQHVACVDAAARVSGARVVGAKVDSRTLEFEPSPIRDWPLGDLEIDIGTAGSTTLVVQTILMPAIVNDRPWRAQIKGGTHNPMAPPFDFLARAFVPQLQAMGCGVTIECVREGFVPTGGGMLRVDVGPGGPHPYSIRPSPVVKRRATILLSGLPTHVGEREAKTLAKRGITDCEIREVNRGGPANLVIVEAERENGVREVVTVFGEKKLRAEVVAERAANELATYEAHGHPVGEHLADQLMLPLAIVGGGSFRAGPLSLHSTTNIDTIKLFLDVDITVVDILDGVEVTVGARR